MPSPDPFGFAGWNPLAGNPLRSRADVEAGLRALVAPLAPFVSEGGARVRVSSAAAHFDQAAADLEGFARPLWGLAPAAVGGADWIDWPRIAAGLANGVDPGHPEYWGDVGDRDQRMVELAAIGYALRLVPDRLSAPLDARARGNLARYLLDARLREFASNNWKFFRVMIDLGLEAVGVDFDPAPSERYLDDLDALYLGDGWYRDGPHRRVDHYIPFAMHFYGLLLAAYGGRAGRASVYRARARALAPEFARWFAADGAAIAFGRSMTYRFAMAAFWGALAVADEEALPWGEVKGLYLRHLRWWSRQPIADRDGVLSIGYGYPNLLMSEAYNSAGSPYCALKAFAPLALPDSHPFWQAEELPPPAAAPVSCQPQPGALIYHPPGDAVALIGGQETREFRHGAEKYSKFAYSARYAFSIESDATAFDRAAFDGALGLSDDGRHFRARDGNAEARIAADILYARWRPRDDVEVETWLLPAPPGHLRVHRIRTPRPLASIEGGFAVARTDAERDRHESSPALSLTETTTDLTAIRDLGSTIARRGRCQPGQPNTNLIAARTWVPQLTGDIPAGETILRCYVVASPDRAAARAALAEPAPAPEIPALVARMRDGRPVGAMTPDA